MILTICIILFILWLLGLLSGVGGSLIHLALVIAVLILVVNLITGKIKLP